jgi:hypothetical protein
VKNPQEVARKRVERGYKWLVTKGPKYGLDINRVDVNRLSMTSSSMCVLGQASRTKTFHLAVDGIVPRWYSLGLRCNWIVRRGFNVCTRSIFHSVDHRGVSLHDLSLAWVDVLTEHQAKKAAVDV